jgi:hypothetical protein
MPSPVSDTRFARIRDIPLVKRLAEHGTVLDSEMGCTRENGGPNNGLFSSILFPQRSLYTLVARCGDDAAVGQFRLKTSDHLAQAVYLAPELSEGMDDSACLHLLDGMAAEAGKRGAHMLSAEVDEHGPLFKTMRQAGFAVYARQEIWRRAPGPSALPSHITPAELSEETDADAMDIQLLYSNIVPRLVQQIAVPSSESVGLVYRQDDRVQGYVAISEGKYGIYVLPYLHPDILFTVASSIIAGAVAHSSRGDKLPVYVCVRRYQDWLEEAMVELGFEMAAQQAVLVRHITAGVRQAAFAPLTRKLEAGPAPVHPPTSRVVEPVIDKSQQE